MFILKNSLQKKKKKKAKVLIAQAEEDTDPEMVTHHLKEAQERLFAAIAINSDNDHFYVRLGCVTLDVALVSFYLL